VGVIMGREEKINRFERYLTGKEGTYETWIKAAKDYVGKFDEGQLAYMSLKPFGGDMFNESYFTLMYNLLNLLKQISLQRGSRVLEVGSGPGWVTEILMGLGYKVDCLEPSEDFVDFARTRIASYAKHLKYIDFSKVKVYCETLEQCSLPTDTYDGIIFFDALHHIVDEKKGLDQCYRLLKPGGCIGISEGAWLPGDQQLEDFLDQEIKRFGTYESPFTIDYLDYLLDSKGFVAIERYNQVNGLFPVWRENQTVRQIADSLAELSNIVIAYKPYKNGSTLDNPFGFTSAEIKLIRKQFDHNKRLANFAVELINQGDTVWINNRTRQKGFVTLAFYQGKLGKSNFREMPRTFLPEPVHPGQKAVIDVQYYIPKDRINEPWYFDLVNEEYYWFSTRGTNPLKIEL